MLMTKSSSLESVLSVLSSLSYRGKIWLYQKKTCCWFEKAALQSLSEKKKKRKKLHQGEAREGRTAREGVRFSWPKSEI